MEKHYYSQIEEEVYFEHLDNGLEVILIPKVNFYQTYALFTTKFGSIDQTFIPRGKKELIRMPDGIAHFLEHKLFEKETVDAFQLFGQMGASSNAFTSFTRTGYEFSTTTQLEENVTTLLDFVQDPYFTEKTIEKEKSIIEQEIQMYEDDPDWRVFLGLLENLYPDQPIQIDIAGTVDSIQEITKEMLYENYDTFYHPSNMQLVIAGNMKVEELMTLIRDNQNEKSFSKAEPIQRVYPEEDLTHFIPHQTIYLSVSKPKVLMGIRGTFGQVDRNQVNGVEIIKKRVAMSLLLDLLFGGTSTNYLRLYDEGLIDGSFNYDYAYEDYFDYLTVGGDTKNPIEFSQIIKNILLQAADSEELTGEHFKLVKKQTIGLLLQGLNSPDYIGNAFFDYYYKDATLFDLIPIVESVSLEDVQLIARQFMKKERLSTFYVLPQKETKE